MKKYTQKQLKDLVKNNRAVDITNGDNTTRNNILKSEGSYSKIGYSAGVYGLNGLLLEGDNTKTLYAITSRSTSLFIFN